MSKVNQVTNEEERQLMQGRIIKAAIMIESMPDGEEKTKYLKAYDEMVSLLLAYNRAQYCKTYPGVRAIYEQLGWVVADVKTEQRDTSAQAAMKNNEDEKKFNEDSCEQPAEVKDEYEDAPGWL